MGRSFKTPGPSARNPASIIHVTRDQRHSGRSNPFWSHRTSEYGLPAKTESGARKDGSGDGLWLTYEYGGGT